MTKRDFYEVLGLDRNASVDDIKKAYKQKAKIHHPDAGGDKEAFQEVLEAYECLTDSEKKARYDQFGHNSGRQSQRYEHYQRPIRRGPNMSILVKLTLEEIYTGVKKVFKYKREDICTDCHGHGGTKITNCHTCGGSGTVIEIFNTPIGQFKNIITCHDCNGTGETFEETCGTCSGSGTKTIDETIEIEIPSGVQDGVIFSMGGKGSFIRNGVAGDLHIKIMELPHKDFVRNGVDLKTTIKLSYYQLVLGDKVEISTIDGGRIRIAVPEYSKVGSNLRIPKKGLKGFGNDNRGELMISLDISIPTNISGEERELIEKLKALKLAPKETN